MNNPFASLTTAEQLEFDFWGSLETPMGEKQAREWAEDYESSK